MSSARRQEAGSSSEWIKGAFFFFPAPLFASPSCGFKIFHWEAAGEAGINAEAGVDLEQRLLPKLTSRRLLPERRCRRGEGGERAGGFDGNGGLCCGIEHLRDGRF